MRKNPLDTKILLSTLKHSSLKTVLVEGNDDVEIYQKVQRKINIRNLDFLPTGGRNTLLEVFERREELDSSKIMFIADKDSWIFSEIPEKYKDIFFTNGYCVENDLFADSEDFLLNFFEEDERKRFFSMVKNIIPWYSYEIKKIVDNTDDKSVFEVSLLSEKVLNRKTNKLTDKFLRDKSCLDENSNLCQVIESDYALKLRGKYLFQILLLIFQERKKKDSESKAISYTREQLFDICFNDATKDKDKISNMNTMIGVVQKFAG